MKSAELTGLCRKMIIQIIEYTNGEGAFVDWKDGFVRSSIPVRTKFLKLSKIKSRPQIAFKSLRGYLFSQTSRLNFSFSLNHKSGYSFLTRSYFLEKSLSWLSTAKLVNSLGIRSRIWDKADTISIRVQFCSACCIVLISSETGERISFILSRIDWVTISKLLFKTLIPWSLNEVGCLCNFQSNSNIDQQFFHHQLAKCALRPT